MGKEAPTVDMDMNNMDKKKLVPSDEVLLSISIYSPDHLVSFKVEFIESYFIFCGI